MWWQHRPSRFFEMAQTRKYTTLFEHPCSSQRQGGYEVYKVQSLWEIHVASARFFKAQSKKMNRSPSQAYWCSEPVWSYTTTSTSLGYALVARRQGDLLAGQGIWGQNPLELQVSAHPCALSEGTVGMTITPAVVAPGGEQKQQQQKLTLQATLRLESIFKYFLKGSDNRNYRCARAHLLEIEPFSLPLFPDFLTAGPHSGSGLGYSSCGIHVWVSFLVIIGL